MCESEHILDIFLVPSQNVQWKTTFAFSCVFEELALKVDCYSHAPCLPISVRAPALKQEFERVKR